MLLTFVLYKSFFLFLNITHLHPLLFQPGGLSAVILQSMILIFGKIFKFGDRWLAVDDECLGTRVMLCHLIIIALVAFLVFLLLSFETIEAIQSDCCETVG